MNKTAMALIAIVAISLPFQAALPTPILGPAGTVVPQQLDYFERVIRFETEGFPSGLAGFGLESYSLITAGTRGWSRASHEDAPPAWFPGLSEEYFYEHYDAYSYQYDSRSRLFAVVSKEFRLVESIEFETRTSDAQLMESLGRYLIQKLGNPVTGDQEDDRGYIGFAGPGGSAIGNDPISLELFMNESFIVLTLKRLM